MTTALGPDAIKALAAAALQEDPAIPAGHTGALLAVVNLDHVEIAIATRVGKGWTVDLTARYAWKGDPKIEATLTRTW